MILDDILKNLNDKNNRENISYVNNGISYTYYDLLKYVSNIYHYLKEKIKENDSQNEINSIIIYGHKEIYMKSAILASSFLGYAYVVIDSSNPKNRILEIAKELQPKAILGLDDNYFEQCFLSNCNFFDRNIIEEIMNKEEFLPIEKIYMKPENIYYMIFTSGSTGKPKGVKITYNNLESCVRWLEKILDLKENEVIINQAIFSFDLSVADFYLSLIKNSIHFILEANLINLSKTYNDLKMSNGKIMVITPSFAELLLLDETFNEKMMPNLKTIIFCGEELCNKTVFKLCERFPKTDIINMYGPTECTYAVTSIKLDRNKKYEKIPLGKVKDDCLIKIVDDNLNEIKDNSLGEILIVGNSVSDGYLDESKNDKFILYNGKRAYLTGDIGYIKDNLLFFVQRKDSQIKYQGYRIDLLDIKENLLKNQNIDKVIVVPKKDEFNKVTKIYAFIKLNETNISEDYNCKMQIKEELKKLLPNYMIPNIKIIKEIPLNQNGKCDKKKLMEDYA